MIAPTLFCDVDGSYMGPDGKTHVQTAWQNYSTFSLWDTYRAAHPLYSIIDQKRAADMVTRSWLSVRKTAGCRYGICGLQRRI